MLEPAVRPIPSSDDDFSAAAAGALARARAAGLMDIRLGMALVSELKKSYPNVVARQMEPLAAIGELGSVWYVFRDGDGAAHVDGDGDGRDANANSLMVLWLTAERAINGATPETDERAELTRLADEAREQYQAALDDDGAAGAD